NVETKQAHVDEQLAVEAFAALGHVPLFVPQAVAAGPAVVHDDDARVLHIGCVRPVSARATRYLPPVLKFTPSTGPWRSDFSHRSPRTRRLRQGSVSNQRLSPDQQMPNPGRWPRRCLVGRSVLKPIRVENDD